MSDVNSVRATNCAALLLLGSAAASAAEPAAPIPTEASAPPLCLAYVATLPDDAVYDALRGSKTFASLDKEKPGCPAGIRVTHSYGHTSAGTASSIASAIFAGATLGLLPVVSNRDLVITYQLLVNGSVLLSYSYNKNFTRVFNIHSKDKTYGLGTEGLAWVTSTAAQFANDAALDPRYAELQSEYHFYYDPPSASAAAR